MSFAISIIDAVIGKVDQTIEKVDRIVHSDDSGDSDAFPEQTQQTTVYCPDVTSRFAQAKREMNWLYDGLQWTVLSQLDLFHQSHPQMPSNMKVLDFACGDGNFSRAISDRFGYGKIVGADASESQLELAHQRTARGSYPNVSYQQMAAGKTSDGEVESLGGPFDIVLAIWLFNYAESKAELLEYIRCVHSMLKPGGVLIAVAPTIENIRDADNGLIKGDSRFNTVQLFENGLKEGMYLCKEGPDGQMQHHTHCYTFNTYDTLLEISGFGEVRFMEGDDFSQNRGSNSSQDEKELFTEYMAWKGSCTGVFVAVKL